MSELAPRGLFSSLLEELAHYLQSLRVLGEAAAVTIAAAVASVPAVLVRTWRSQERCRHERLRHKWDGTLQCDWDNSLVHRNTLERLIK